MVLHCPPFNWNLVLDEQKLLRIKQGSEEGFFFFFLISSRKKSVGKGLTSQDHLTEECIEDTDGGFLVSSFLKPFVQCSGPLVSCSQSLCQALSPYPPLSLLRSLSILTNLTTTFCIPPNLAKDLVCWPCAS